VNPPEIFIVVAFDLLMVADRIHRIRIKKLSGFGDFGFFILKWLNRGSIHLDHQ